MSGLCPVTLVCPSAITDSVASAVAGAVFDTISSSMSAAADWFIGQAVDLIDSGTAPVLDAGWFLAQTGQMIQVAEMVVLPVLLVATIGPVLRQDLHRLARIWGVGLPVAVLAGFAAPFLAAQMVAATDALCSVLIGPEGTKLANGFSNAMASQVVSAAPQFAGIVIAVVAIVGGVLVWLELVLRSAAVYLATFFMPLVLVGYIWPATAHMARRGVEILSSLILSKLVIVAAVVLGLGALSQAGADPLFSGAAILLMAAFAPFAIMRLTPVVEAQAIGHLEGMSHRPARAATRLATAAAGAPTHPITQLVMSARDRSSPPGPTGVTEQSIPMRQADYPTGGTSPGEGGHG